jgi:hypothetical protein
MRALPGAKPRHTLESKGFKMNRSLTLTVDLTRFRGRVEAVWFHPTTGNSAPVPGSPFANSGPQDFLSSGEERSGRL